MSRRWRVSILLSPEQRAQQDVVDLTIQEMERELERLVGSSWTRRQVFWHTELRSRRNGETRPVASWLDEAPPFESIMAYRITMLVA